jgi:hypothetical protein
MSGTLVALLFPGTVFCCLMAMEWWQTGKTPIFQIYGKQIPIPLVYLIVFLAGLLFLILMLSDIIKRIRC